MWKEELLDVQVLVTHGQFIDYRVKERNSAFSGFISFVYGKNEIKDRKALWAYLKTISVTITEPWCINDDFNAVLSSGDRIRDQDISDADTRFSELLDSCNLLEMKTCGNFYTWSNGHVNSKIDRAICNMEWLNCYHDVYAEFKERNISDHFPCFIEISSYHRVIKRPFQFLNALVDLPGFSNYIREHWDMDISGTNMFKLWEKLKHCRNPLNNMRKIELARINLENVQKGICKAELEKWHKVQESIFKKLSRDQWIK